MAEESALGLVAKINQELDKASQKADALIKALAGSSGGTGTSGGSMMPGSLAAVNAAGQTMNRMQTAATIVQGVTKVAGNVVGMLPDVGATVARAGGYYAATVRVGGGMSRRVLESVTFNGLQGGLSKAGIDAEIAAYAGTVGLNPNTPLYRQLLAGAGNATKYLNMDTMSAFQAMEGLTAGVGSGNLMARYGIFTSDPRTGRVRSQNEIFGELADRMTAGQPRATEAQILEDLRRGPLGSNIRNSGLSADQQYMFSQYMIERARGRTLDLSDPNTMKQMMAEAEAQGNANPFAAAYRISTAQTGAMGAAEQNYLKAIQDATPAIEAMNEAAGKLSDSFIGYANALGQTLLGDRATGGGLGALGSIATTIGSVAAGTMMGKGLLSKAGNVAVKAGQSALGKGARVGGVTALAGLAATGVGEGIKMFSGSKQGDLTNKFANAISSAGQAGGTAALSFLVPGLQAAAPFITGAAALAGGIYGFATGGEPSSVGMGGMSDTTGASALNRPVQSGEISAYYGEKGSVWRAGYHKGTDFAVPIGTNVYAAAAGKVIAVQTTEGTNDFGLHVKLDHGNGYETIYAHLSQVLVKIGDEVQKGQLIGKSGESGRVTGPHLHFEVRKNGAAVDPGALVSGGIVSGSSSGQGSSEGLGQGKSQKNGAAGTILDIVLGHDSALAPSINMTLSGVKGNYQTTAQIAGAAMSGGTVGMTSPAVAATGATLGSGVSSQVPVGGEGSYISLAATSRIAHSTANGSPVVPSSGATSVTKPNVNINVTIAQSSPAEAKKLAEMVKSYLEDDAIIANMGRR